MRSISGTSKGLKKRSFTYRMFHLSDFWENGSFMNKKKEEWKKGTKKQISQVFLCRFHKDYSNYKVYLKVSTKIVFNSSLLQTNKQAILLRCTSSDSMKKLKLKSIRVSMALLNSIELGFDRTVAILFITF